MSADISICLLFPDLLGTYGDGGNATVLSQRLSWRAISNEVIAVNMNEKVPIDCNIYVLGGGEDQPQSAVTDLLGNARPLHQAVDRGAVVLAVCAGMQILGNEFAVAGGNKRPGLGLVDIVSDRGNEPRCVGEIVVRPDPEIGSDLLTGYENHGGRTMLGSAARPLGQVKVGRGNDDGTGAEGVLQGNIVGTYLHGPALARNPSLADALLTKALQRDLAPLDDTEIEEMRTQRLRVARSECAPRARA